MIDLPQPSPRRWSICPVVTVLCTDLAQCGQRYVYTCGVGVLGPTASCWVDEWATPVLVSSVPVDVCLASCIFWISLRTSARIASCRWLVSRWRKRAKRWFVRWARRHTKANKRNLPNLAKVVQNVKFWGSRASEDMPRGRRQGAEPFNIKSEEHGLRTGSGNLLNLTTHLAATLQFVPSVASPHWHLPSLEGSGWEGPCQGYQRHPERHVFQTILQLQRSPNAAIFARSGSMSFHYSSLSAGLPFRPFRRRLEQLQLRSFPSLRPPRAAQHWAQHWAAPRGYLDRLQLRRHRWCVRRLGPPPRWGRWAMESPRGCGRPAAAEDTWPKERMVGTPWHPQRNKVMMLEIHSQNSQKFRCRDCWVNVLSYLATCNIMQLSMPHPHIAIIAETLVINGIVSQELQSSPRRRVTNPDACADPQVWSSSRWLKQNINNVSQITTPTIASGMHNKLKAAPTVDLMAEQTPGWNSPFAIINEIKLRILHCQLELPRSYICDMCHSKKRQCGG